METIDDADADAQENEYAWEGSFERTWDSVQIGADGTLRGSRQERRSARQPVQRGVKRGMLRTLYVVIDCSRNAIDQDGEMRPSRLAVMKDAVASFITDFFEQNPISSLALILSRNGKAEVLTMPSCNAGQHLKHLRNIQPGDCRGDASLQNGLDLARDALEAVPSFMSREVLVLSSSLATCDPGDIHATIAALARSKVRCFVYSLLAEVYICKRIATQTGGHFSVATTPAHLRELVLTVVPPRPTEEGTMAPSRSLIKVGFPERQPEGVAQLCFLAGQGHTMGLAERVYTCPQCCANQQEIPTQCPVCNLKLLSAAELTKTYHHLFPVPSFVQPNRPVPTLAAAPALAGGGQEDCKCFGCRQMLGNDAGLGAECPECGSVFCEACDIFIHEALHSCPGCACRSVDGGSNIRRTLAAVAGGS